jgi:hypothetical protein
MPVSPADKPPTARRPVARSVADAFTRQIEAAEQDGVDRADMTLNLTLNDMNELKRDRSLPVEDISFSAGQMRFKGVKVKGGGVTASSLDLGQT